MVLETAHPVKFPDAVEGCIGKSIEIPAAVQSIIHKEKKSTLINASYKELKAFLLK